MQVYDIIMLVVLAVAVGFGLWKGLAWQLASIASLFASYVVAFMFRDPLAAYITTDPPWNIFLAMLILYVATALGIWIVFHLVSGVIEKLKLKEFDSQLGGLFGLVKGLVLCAVITLFAVTLLGEDLKKQILGSNSGYYLAIGLDHLDAVMPKELHDVVAPYLHPLSEKIGGHPHDHAAADPPTAPGLPLAIAKEAVTKEVAKGVIPSLVKAVTGNSPAAPNAPATLPSAQAAAKPAIPAAILAPKPLAAPSSQPAFDPEPSAASVAARPNLELAPMSPAPTSPAVTIQPMPRQPATVPSVPASSPVAPANWPSAPGNYDPYAGPPAGFGQGKR